MRGRHGTARFAAALLVRNHEGDIAMADDKNNRGAQDRAQVAGGEDYEVDYFAGKHGLTREQAQDLISRHGNNREVLDREAERMTSKA
jgi:hypothetical protein